MQGETIALTVAFFVVLGLCVWGLIIAYTREDDGVVKQDSIIQNSALILKSNTTSFTGDLIPKTLSTDIKPSLNNVGEQIIYTINGSADTPLEAYFNLQTNITDSEGTVYSTMNYNLAGLQAPNSFVLTLICNVNLDKSITINAFLKEGPSPTIPTQEYIVNTTTLNPTSENWKFDSIISPGTVENVITIKELTIARSIPNVTAEKMVFT